MCLRVSPISRSPHQRNPPAASVSATKVPGVSVSDIPPYVTAEINLLGAKAQSLGVPNIDFLVLAQDNFAALAEWWAFLADRTQDACITECALRAKTITEEIHRIRETCGI